MPVWYRAPGVAGTCRHAPVSSKSETTRFPVNNGATSETRDPAVCGDTTVAHKYNTSLNICTLLLCRAVFLLCSALFGSAKHFSSMLRVFCNGLKPADNV